MSRKPIFARAKKWSERASQKEMRDWIIKRLPVSSPDNVDKYLSISDRAAYTAGYEAALRDAKK